MKLEGKVAVVTGASSGLGAAIAEALHGQGMTVVAAARRLERLEALATNRPGIKPYAVDVTDDAQVAGMAKWVREELGACHVLVNCAGAIYGRFYRQDDVRAVKQLMDLNFFGAVRCMGAFADLLFANTPSRVINVASVAGKVAGGVPPAYSASKFATVGFSEAVDARWRARGVTVSQLNPGFIITEGFPQTRLIRSRAKGLLLGEPRQVAEAAVQIARGGSPERTVPRRYRPLVVGRHLLPPLYRAIIRRI